jgi:hypothetical protein
LFKQQILAAFNPLTDADRDDISSLADETEVAELEEDLRQRKDNIPEEDIDETEDNHSGNGDYSDGPNHWVNDDGSEDEGEVEKRKKLPGFWASDRWGNGFLKRTKLSLRKLHPKRGSTPNDAIIADFIAEIAEAFATYHPDRIFNMDATSWKLLNADILILAERGTEFVKCHFSVEVKDSLTAIAIANAAGQNQSLSMLAKCKTEKSE